jgi:hypothetical protein
MSWIVSNAKAFTPEAAKGIDWIILTEDNWSYASVAHFGPECDRINVYIHKTECFEGNCVCVECTTWKCRCGAEVPEGVRTMALLIFGPPSKPL